MENTPTIPTAAALKAKGIQPDVLFWVGCAGSYDERYKKVTLAFVKILNALNINYAVLGDEEACTGDPARRAGNEFLFQMQAAANIQVLNGYNIKKIVTACPHCFNTLKNEYPDLGGHYDVVHHSQFLQQLMDEGKLVIEEDNAYKNQKVTFHDSCFLGRANGVYAAPRQLIESLRADLVEMKRHKSNGLCCGAGGAQMFKEPEPGEKDINIERSEEAMATGARVVASACPFCMTMLTDGVKNKGREGDVKVLDIAEMLVKAQKKPQ
jgi:Fe-S oxidoreductase